MAGAAGPAYKLSAADVLAAAPSPDGGGYVHRGVVFTRAWVQARGVLVGASPDNKELLLDDGTAVLPLRCVAGKRGKDGRETDPESVRLQELFAGRSPVGSYVLAVGKVHAAGGESRGLRWRRLEDLSSCPDREALWALECVELWRDAPLPLKS